MTQIEFKSGQTIIQRQNGHRQISIRINIVGRDQGSFVKEAQEKVQKELTLPRGYSLQWGGQYANLERAGKKTYCCDSSDYSSYLWIFISSL